MKKTAFAAAAVALFAMATACSDKANNTEATEAPAKKPQRQRVTLSPPPPTSAITIWTR